VDLPAGGARVGAPQLRATEGDPGAQEPYPLPQGADRGAHQGGPTSGEGAPGCRDKALFRGHARAWCFRKGSCADALVGGTTDPEVLAELARGRLRSKLPALRDALEGSFSSHHALMVGKILAHVDYLDESIGDLSAEIERVIAPFSDKVELLDTIPGVNRRTAETLIAEIGVDMDQFPTHKHLASWAGMCPGNEESAGKRRSGKTRKGSKWLRSALTESARAAARSKETYLASHYARLRGRRGSKKAAVAVGHSILVICYHVLERQVPYEDLGEDYFDRRRSSEAYAKRLVRKLERLGHKVALETLPQSA
jgi:transposase